MKFWRLCVYLGDCHDQFANWSRNDRKKQTPRCNELHRGVALEEFFTADGFELIGKEGTVGIV